MCNEPQKTLIPAAPDKVLDRASLANSTSQMLNRRNFLRLGSLAGATLLAVGSLAACGSIPELSSLAQEPPATVQEAEVGMYILEQKNNSGGSTPRQPVPGDTSTTLSIFTKTPPNLTAWLNQHPNVRDAIVWQDENTPIKYLLWPAPLKFRLQDIFDSIWTANPVYPGQYKLPLNIMNLNDPTTSQTVLTKADALTGYLDYLAYSLRTELAKQVSWSMLGYSSALLANLLDSRVIYEWVTAPGPTLSGPLPAGYPGGYQIKWVNLPTHPSFSLQFLKDNNLIGLNVVDTIGRLIYWCGFNLIHMGLTPAMKDLSSGELNYNVWHYRGAIPILNMITGTDPTDPLETFEHWTYGCWGTTAFMKMVLQILNIPIDYVYMEGHCLPHFLSDGTYMSHGDDPYPTIRLHPGLKGTDFLIYQASFDSHFGPGVSAANKLKNVGFRYFELMQQFETIDAYPNLPPVTKPPIQTVKL